MQKAIDDARGNANRKSKANDESNTGDLPEDDVTTTGQADAMSPPKPPRVFTYADKADVTSSNVQPTNEHESSDVDDQKDSGIALDNVDTSVEDPGSSSLQQNPFKLTIKRKESVPQAVVKPISVAPAGTVQ